MVDLKNIALAIIFKSDDREDFDQQNLRVYVSAQKHIAVLLDYRGI